jgi:hypothetical protein
LQVHARYALFPRVVLLSRRHGDQGLPARVKRVEVATITRRGARRLANINRMPQHAARSFLKAAPG